MSQKAAMTSFTQDELLRLMRYMRVVDPQMHAICLLALWHGMRRGEVLALTTNNFVDGRVVFSRLKGSLSANHKLQSHAAPEFDEMRAIQPVLQVRNDGRALFDHSERQVNRLLERYCEAVDIHRTKAHMSSFKHSCCRLLLDSGMGIDKLAGYVGHKEPKNTLRYTRTTDEAIEDELERLKHKLDQLEDSQTTTEPREKAAGAGAD
jgi:integrase